MELKHIIKKLRGDRTQEQFAQELGVSKQAVSQWETGATEPSEEQRGKLGITVKTRYILNP